MRSPKFWSSMPVVARRFWAVAAAMVLVGPFLGWQSAETVDPLTVAAGSLAIIVILTWFAEASFVEGWPVRVVTLVAAASFAIALLPWSGALVGWLVVLLFAAIAVEDRKPVPTAAKDVAEVTPQNTVGELPSLEDSLETDDSIVSSQVRRISDGYECVEGVIVSVAAGPTHVVFHPPLQKTPEVEIHAIDDCDARLAESTPYGLRVNTSGPGRIAFTAASPAA